MFAVRHVDVSQDPVGTVDSDCDLWSCVGDFAFVFGKSEERLIRLTFWDTLSEQVVLSDQSALIDASLWRKNLFKKSEEPQARDQKLNRAKRYENEMV